MTEEWIPPQRPLSEEMTMKSWREGEDSGDECWNISAFAAPYSLPACMARWAFASFVDAIIFIDCGG